MSAEQPTADQQVEDIRPPEDLLWHLKCAQRNAEILLRGGIIEVAILNPNVRSYMEHWEGRALKAEAEVERLRKLASQLVIP